MIDLEWVKDYIDIEDQDLKELAVKITKAGINIEKVISNHIDNLVIGEVIECEMHPDSDHLHVCLVNVGDRVLQIVCGAPNVRKGLKVIVALSGAILPGDFEIKKSKIRGVESNGMLCALFELGLEEKNEETYSKGIYEVDSKAKVGTDAMKYLNLDDTLYELDVHKHRNNDCYYHIGFAYEIGAILNRPVTLPDDKTKPIKDEVKNYFSLRVETDKCPYYLAKMVTNVKIGESPEFIKRRLTAYGMRSINNVVDISNYVMLEYGQPLHFFDKDALGEKIVVRNAKDGEKIRTLDGVDRILSSDDIVITDGKKPVCIAGVMGGENTEVTSDTKTILIESAIFDGVSIRNTSNRLDLRSEASIRYGKGLSYEYTEKAIERACHLLEKYAGAKVLSGTVKHDKIDKTPKIVKFNSSEINTLLGITISDDDVKVELNRLGFPFEYNNGEFKATIPSRRLDIDPYVNDIAEEVGRLYGYHNLVSTLPSVAIKKGEYALDIKYRKILSKRLRGLGLNEVKTYTLTSPKMASSFKYEDKKQITLPLPMSVDKSVIRTSLIPSLLKVYEYNRDHKVNDVNIYEIAKTYDASYNEESKVCMLMSSNYLVNQWHGVDVKVDFYLIKGIVQNVLDYLGFKNRYTFEKRELPDLHPGICAGVMLDRKMIGVIGKVHPIITKDDIYVAELSLEALMGKVKAIKFKEAPKYPEIVKDMAFIVNNDVTSDEIISVIRKAGGRLLTDIKLFDVYTGEHVANGEKSLAYSLTFSSLDRTLSEEEVMKVFDKIIKDVENKLGAKLRNK